MQIVAMIFGILSIFIVLTIFLLSQFKASEKSRNVHKELIKEFYEVYLPQTKTKISLLENLLVIFNFQSVLTVMAIVINSSNMNSCKIDGAEILKSHKKDKKFIISTIFLEKKLEKIYRTYLILGASGGINLLLINFFEELHFISWIILLLIVAVVIYQLILTFRVKNGLFGTNSYEARELIEFIEHNSDKFDDQGNILFNEEKFAEYIIGLREYGQMGRDELAKH